MTRINMLGLSDPKKWRYYRLLCSEHPETFNELYSVEILMIYIYSVRSKESYGARKLPQMAALLLTVED
jgi:hypothetical protein